MEINFTDKLCKLNEAYLHLTRGIDKPSVKMSSSYFHSYIKYLGTLGYGENDKCFHPVSYMGQPVTQDNDVVGIVLNRGTETRKVL